MKLFSYGLLGRSKVVHTRQSAGDLLGRPRPVAQPVQDVAMQPPTAQHVDRRSSNLMIGNLEKLLLVGAGVP